MILVEILVFVDVDIIYGDKLLSCSIIEFQNIDVDLFNVFGF